MVARSSKSVKSNKNDESAEFGGSRSESPVDDAGEGRSVLVPLSDMEDGSRDIRDDGESLYVYDRGELQPLLRYVRPSRNSSYSSMGSLGSFGSLVTATTNKPQQRLQPHVYYQIALHKTQSDHDMEHRQGHPNHSRQLPSEYLAQYQHQQQQRQYERSQLVLTACVAILVLSLLCGPLILTSTSPNHESRFSFRRHKRSTSSRLVQQRDVPDFHRHSSTRIPSIEVPSFDQRNDPSVLRQKQDRSGGLHRPSWFSPTSDGVVEVVDDHRTSSSPQAVMDKTAADSTVGETAGHAGSVPADTSTPAPRPASPLETNSNPEVSSSSPHFPSYATYRGRPYFVSYGPRTTLGANSPAADRNLYLNGHLPIVLLGGSMHPSRATRATWNQALDHAVQQGLNLVTIYVFWAAHQPQPGHPLDWTLPFAHTTTSIGVMDNPSTSSTSSASPWIFQPPTSAASSPWTLADAIQACGDRGLFVHIRVGPYNCAEYSYGGLPEWIATTATGNTDHNRTQAPPRRMRRMDENWLNAMEGFVRNATAYVTQHQLWAHQGGPIILAQIENELGDDSGGFMQNPQAKKMNHGPSELQQYADWCGDLVQRVAPEEVVWTMCNGLTANSTIETYNGDWGAVDWLQHHGQNGRILRDQPALWTEDEGGFQLWGEEPSHPTDYFWGITARDMSKNAIRWFARGGIHLNYYMWWGGYNRGRSAAAGILNAYAVEAILCPCGQPRQPKFGHLKVLHEVLASVATLLVTAPELPSPTPVACYDSKNDTWNIERHVLATTFANTDDPDRAQEVIFLENNGPAPEEVKVPSLFAGPEEEEQSGSLSLKISPYAAMIVVDGALEFDSANIGPGLAAFERQFDVQPLRLLDWKAWQEILPAFTVEQEKGTIVDNNQSWCHELQDRPMEQTLLNVNHEVYSDYAWYSTTFSLDEPMENASLIVETQKANGLLVYVDGVFRGSTENHEHSEGDLTVEIPMGSLNSGEQTLHILSESFGYHNLIGRWGAGVGAKRKGLTGNVIVRASNKEWNLTNGNYRWCSRGGLQGEEHQSLPTSTQSNPHIRSTTIFRSSGSPQDSVPSWFRATFDTPLFSRADQKLFLRLVGGGRGHLWLNGHDLGRFWNITRSNQTSVLSQEYYHLPQDYLFSTSGRLNELVIFDVFGGGSATPSGQAHQQRYPQVELVLSWIDTSVDSKFLDEVGFADSCLV